MTRELRMFSPSVPEVRWAVRHFAYPFRSGWLSLLAAALLALVAPARAGVVCWSEQGGSIWLANVDGTAIRQILSSTGGARGVCVDTARGKVYWAAYSGNYIGRANLDGSGVEVVTSASTPAGVAIDSAGGRLFFAEYGNGGQVVQCNLDGSNRIVLTTATANPTGIVYGDGYVYFTDWNDQYNGVFRVPAGGGTRSTVASGINGSYGVTYESTGYVWFGDWTTDTIIRRAANGSGSNLVVASGSMAADSWGISVDPDGSGVYWARQLGGGIFRGSTGGGSVGPALPTTSTPWGVCVFAGRGPSIFAQPQSQSVLVGQPVTLSVGVSGTPYFRYQWVRNGSDIPGATSSTYTIGSAGLGSAGQYWVNVWSPLGAVSSQPATLNVSNPCEVPTFTEQPQSVATCEGLAVSWSAAAVGTLPISYRWQRNGVDIPGANTGTLNVQSVTQATAGEYTCIATGPCGSTTSAVAQLLVRTAPVVLSQPQSQSAPTGGSAVLFMQIAADQTAAFRWSLNGVELSDGPRVSGATTPSLSLSNLGLDGEGTYTCAVTVACGSVVSQRAVLSLTDCPRSWSNLGGGPFGNRANMAQTYSPVNGGTLCFGGVIDGDLMSGVTWLLTGNSWRQVADSGPSARYIASMCELPNGHVLLFGGQAAFQTLPTTLGDTWEWDGQAWSRVATSGPAPRAGHSMVYDSARERVVLFGGLGATGNLYRDTWEWSGNQWTRVADAGPTPRFGQAMAFDPVSREMIMFGGFSATGFATGTWAWNGQAWRLAATTGVVPRHYPNMTFDASAGRVLLFGGFEGGANVKNDSYYWSGTGWNPTGATTPPAHRWLHGMSFDRTTHSVVVTAGWGLGNAPLSDASVFSSLPFRLSGPYDTLVAIGEATSFNVSAPEPGATFQWRREGVTLIDEGRITGSQTPTLTIADVTWSDVGRYDCTVSTPCGALTTAPATLDILTCDPAWSNQGPAEFGKRWVHAQAYSAINAATLVFGGRNAEGDPLGDTWLGGPNGWARVAVTGPSPRSDHAMTELGNGHVLLFGGSSTPGNAASVLGDTWEWNGGQWILRAVLGPPARLGHTLVYDTIRDRAVLFGGIRADGSPLNDTWEWNGAAWNLVSSGGPSPRFAHASAFDQLRGQTLVIGGYGAAGRNSETWAWDGTAWRLAASTGFQPTFYSAAAFDPRVGRVLMFGGWTAPGLLDTLLSWNGSAWRTEAILGAPIARWTHAASFDAAFGGIVVSGGASLDSGALEDFAAISSLPIASQGPDDATLVPGGAASFSVVSSLYDVSYQWLKDGVNLVDGGRVSGATSRVLTINGLLASDAGLYSCEISNACGDNPSRQAELSCRASVTDQPRGGVVMSGEQILLEPTIVTTGANSFRWRKDGVQLFNSPIYSGVTSRALTINPQDPTQSGNYTLAVTSSCGVTTTRPAEVVVLCTADYNSDDSVDGDDVIAFFADWDAGEPAGDANRDGSVDGDDVIWFFSRWDLGC